jgi:metal-sulfur cluster biosynthetic enzyme
VNEQLSDRDKIIEVLKTVEDPELFLDVWFLGLIYNLNIEGQQVDVQMTFTSPMCPYGPQLVEDVRKAIKGIGFDPVNVSITFDPPWEPSDDVKAMLGMI